MDFLKVKIVELAFTFIVGPLAFLAVQLLKRWSWWVDRMSAGRKRVFVAVTAFVFVVLGAVTGVDFGISPDAENLDFLANLDTTALKTAIAAGLAFLLHALKKAVK